LTAQVREELRARILDGRLAPGAQLPPEIDLARATGVSRTSLREAVMQLEQDGLLIRRHGHGTFVRSSLHLLRSSLDTNLSATELIRAHGMVPGTRDLRLARQEATAHEAERLGITAGDPVVVLERVRSADGRPVVFTRDVFPSSIFAAVGVDPGELRQDNLSVYRFMAERLGLSVVDGTAWVRPDIATGPLATRLEVAAGALIFVIEQVDRDAAERRLLLTWEHYAADAFEFVIHRRNPHLQVSSEAVPGWDQPLGGGGQSPVPDRAGAPGASPVPPFRKEARPTE
jgi:GntR family transcriptional regulator